MVESAQFVAGIVDQFLADVVAAIPRLLSGFVFLVLAYVLIEVVTRALRSALRRAYPGDQHLIADLGVLLASVFLWFGAGLALLRIVGLGDLAASLGTAVGFIALGVSYALSEMIEDTVAGVYLLRDPDFNPGDVVTVEEGTGTVTAIGLRKSRFRLDDGDTLVLANGDVEQKWTKRADESGESEGDGAASA